MLAEELKCKAEYMTQDDVARSGDQGFFWNLYNRRVYVCELFSP